MTTETDWTLDSPHNFMLVGLRRNLIIFLDWVLECELLWASLWHSNSAHLCRIFCLKYILIISLSVSRYFFHRIILHFLLVNKRWRTHKFHRACPITRVASIRASIRNNFCLNIDGWFLLQSHDAITIMLWNLYFFIPWRLKVLIQNFFIRWCFFNIFIAFRRIYLFNRFSIRLILRWSNDVFKAICKRGLFLCRQRRNIFLSIWFW